ncbi:hypothetical protein TVAG_159290 [Trichomonas vaginalis G3]|uniref:RING-type domain-containing protein n=1 Tax=Trichomonas vaginalis (strain ATCC PRA-98 / G3) TaxID=412133 RepID=A2F584_TRIV3|nr:protein polyubiquitination [Trichomonas vaginalis G3]EAX99909.1 hypothetical protein TVAG_159290 [Trichomonas vaginalis G3]KAI5547810.1 protein polyubiquitination [Trichomonas vaginalis G3]|eukprot:XP_001312839.1 hypothetical protein [Trichomonas vaginalis G3]
MKILCFQNYCLVSGFILAMQIRKIMNVKTDFYDICVEIFEDKQTYLSFIIFLTFTSVLLIKRMLDLFIGKLSHSEVLSIAHNFQTKLISLCFEYLAGGIPLHLVEIHYLTKPLLSYVTMLYIRERIHCLQLSPKLPTLNQHHRLITSQFLLLFINLYFLNLPYSKELMKQGNIAYAIAAPLDCILVYNFFEVLLDIITHFVFILDRDKLGSSNKSFHFLVYAEYVCKFLGALFSLIMVSSIVFKQNLQIAFFIFPLFNAFRSIYDIYNKRMRWQRLSDALNTVFPNVTEEDLKRDDTCIICRETMTSTTAKKLPCGHCLHTDCLERWAKDHSICPLCQKDLSALIDGIDKDTHNDDVEQINPDLLD